MDTVQLSDSGTTAAEFRTKPKAKPRTAEIEIQTDSIETKNRKVETNPSLDAEVQTDNLIRPFQLVEDASGNLPSFLNRILPMVEDALEDNVRGSDFDDWDVSWEDSMASVSCLFTLINHSTGASSKTKAKSKVRGKVKAKGKGKGSAISQEEDTVGYVPKSCTAVSWNSTGQVVGVAFGRHDHLNWCTHRGAVATWNILRRSVDPNKPDYILETPTCVTCIAFHPEKPSILATGTFSGDVQVWDIHREDDPLIGTSKGGSSDEAHQEPVTKIMWVADRLQLSRANFNLVSIGTDGKVLGWSSANEYQEPIAQYKFSGYSAGVSDKNSVGGTAMSFNAKDPTVCLAGAEHGGLFKCNVRLNQKSKLRKDKDKDKDTRGKAAIRSPVTMNFDRLPGPVHDIACAYHNRNLFAVCGADSLLRIYSLLQSKPIHVIDCPSLAYNFCVDWSHVRPSVCAIATGDGRVHVFDLLTSKISPVLSLEGSKTTLHTHLPNGGGGRTRADTQSSDESDSDDDDDDIVDRDRRKGKGKKGSKRDIDVDVDADRYEGEGESGTLSQDSQVMYGVAFNPVNTDLIATCGANGVLRIWQLSSDLARPKAREREQLDKWCSSLLT